MNEKKTQFKSVIIVGVIILAGLLTATGLVSITSGNDHTYNVNTFSSYNQLLEFLKSNSDSSKGYGWGFEVNPFNFLQSREVSPSSVDSMSGESLDYSETNIQVEGVDEPDIVKTDGNYLYIIANSKLYIVKAYPPEDAEVLSIIELDEYVYLNDLFINDDRLVIFVTSSRNPVDDGQQDNCWWGIPTTIIKIYDISNREYPELIKDVEMDGSYFNSRMVGNYIYVIATEYSYWILQDDDGTLAIPELTINNVTRKIQPNEIYYYDVPDDINTMTHVIAIDIFNEEVNQKSYLLGSSQNIYVSMNNIYLTYTTYDNAYSPIYESNYNSEQNTIIHRISINNGDITYKGQGRVPGSILNQFSMDEHDGHFRIATTIGHVSRNGGGSTNNVYILDDTLNITGKVEELAPGERIYSVRFMGDKGYVVTFKKVDPLFVIDLSDPNNPSVLGKLKIPGYSDYLHPLDENHIIGIGKDTVEAEYSDFAWYQGIKMALFDVSDYENPIEEAKVIIGDRGTDSPALRDHKAFLFDKEKELLVIPVSLYEIDDEIKQQNNGNTGNYYGDFTFQGVYVYHLSLEDGFEYFGRITHLEDEDILKSGSYWYDWESSIQRSLYIEDVLYTISEDMVKMNRLDDLSEINSVEFV